MSGIARLPRACVALALGLLPAGVPLVSSPAHAADIFEDVVLTSAPVFDIDPSIRSQAMAGAATAVFWGNDANHWANPALLGLAQGVRYEQSDIKPAPNALPGARFRTRRTTLGCGGLGVAMAGQPLEGFGETKLDYGTLPPGVFTGLTQPLYPAETVRAWSVGASAAEAVRSYSRLRRRDAPRFTRYADAAVGFAHKDVEDGTLDPQNPERATSWDWGFVVKATVPTQALVSAAHGRLEFAYAHAVINGNDTAIYSHSTARQYRNGVALRTAFDAPRGWLEHLPGWLAPGLEPLLSMGVSLDAIRITAGARSAGGHHRDGYGGEIALLNALFFRVGHARDDLGAGVSGNTWGIGAGLPLGRWGGVRYDHAQVVRDPRSGDLSADSWSAWLDPVAIYRDAR